MVIEDTSIWVALPLAAAAGAVSFLSPCVAPLVPGFLAFIAPTASSASASAHRRRRVVRTTWFVAGFSIVFTLLGASSAGAISMLDAQRTTLAFVAGALVALLGVGVVFDRSPLDRFGTGGITSQLTTPTGPIGAMLVGAALGIAWTPCIGPVLAGILTIAGASGDIVTGAVLLATYSLGLGIPFVVAALVVDRVTNRAGSLRRYVRVIRIGSGIVLVVIGLAIASGAFATVASHLARVVPSFVL